MTDGAVIRDIERCESCGRLAHVRLLDGSVWCKSCDAAAISLGYEAEGANSRHEDAWHIPTEDSTDYGVLVKCGPPEHPYWWLLCPGTATLYIGADPDLRDCADGEGCNYLEDVHDRAHRLRKALSGRPMSAADGGNGPEASA